jgi:hypothetical protein
MGPVGAIIMNTVFGIVFLLARWDSLLQTAFSSSDLKHY